METNPQVMAAVLRKAADNVENGLCIADDIQIFAGENNGWCTPYLGVSGDDFFIYGNKEYRLVPETVKLKNGVTIPKPLSEDELLCCDDNAKFIPCANYIGYVKVPLYRVCDRGHGEIVYKTKEEAIEASKALFE